MTILAKLAKYNPFGRLVVTCHFPEEGVLIFHSRLGRGWRLHGRPRQVFDLLAVDIQPALTGLERFVSDGAIAGATAAAFRHRDLLTGAVVGEWLEKRQQGPGRSHDFYLALIERTSGEQLDLVFSLSAEDCKTVYRYFRN